MGDESGVRKRMPSGPSPTPEESLESVPPSHPSITINSESKRRCRRKSILRQKEPKEAAKEHKEERISFGTHRPENKRKKKGVYEIHLSLSFSCRVSQRSFNQKKYQFGRRLKVIT
jgi:hypothetical protein